MSTSYFDDVIERFGLCFKGVSKLGKSGDKGMVKLGDGRDMHRCGESVGACEQ